MITEERIDDIQGILDLIADKSFDSRVGRHRSSYL